MWAGINSDWAALTSIDEWVASVADFVGMPTASVALGCGSFERVARTASTLDELCTAYKATCNELSRRLALHPENFFDSEPLDAAASRLSTWLRDGNGLDAWLAYTSAAARARSLALGPLVDAMTSGRLPPTGAVAALELEYSNATLEALRARHDELRHFDGDEHDNEVLRFRMLDCDRIRIARDEVLEARRDFVPDPSMSVLDEEFARRRGHKTIRGLMRTAGKAIQQLKPVMMMSPLSVAQFLEPGALDFDVLIIDEASQVLPVDALGAIARSKQIVVVGDEMQMPPTRFFSALVSDESEFEMSEEFEVNDAESILGLCEARGVFSTMLRWHYRSKHESLISVSNRRFYDNCLYTVPSPLLGKCEFGLHFRHIPNSSYERGTSGTNPEEARIVAEAVMMHARRSPNLSLGVATFSMKQRQAILERLEILRRESPETEGFFLPHGREPFFVKNLENVQGDERDVIFISVCYGRDSRGVLTMNFGPLNQQGGDRRLNVLITRARRRCEVFSQLRASDLNGVSNGALQAFQTFLEYAEAGGTDRLAATPNMVCQPVIEAIVNSLQAKGFDVRRNIGESGLFVDLGIIDPSFPDQYLLGIEIDGASYAAMKSTRDRDRLQYEILCGNGWNIHRVWTPAWVAHPALEFEKILRAIEACRIALEDRARTTRATAHVESAEGKSRRQEAPDVSTGDVVVPYAEAIFSVPNDLPLGTFPPILLAIHVATLVAQEGPIHRSLIVTRMRALWGAKRTSAQMRETVSSAINIAVNAGEIASADFDFFEIPGHRPVLRNRSMLAPNGMVGLIPPSEVRAAVHHALSDGVPASEEHLHAVVGQLLGVSAREVTRADIGAAVAALLRQNLVRREGAGILRSASVPPAPEAGARS
jgi:very-short-patch-repair endonuclease